MVNDFWQRIKHGNVAKVAAAYAALSWILLQAQEAVLPTIGAPIWVQQTVLFLLLVGFPIACLIAWASDLQSAQTRSEETSVQIASTVTETNPIRKTLVLTGLPVLALIALFAFYISPYVFDFGGSAVPAVDDKPRLGRNLNSELQSPRFEINLGKTGVSEWGLQTELAISPDGRFLAFTKNLDGGGEVFVRDLWKESDVRLVATYRWGTDVHGVLDFSDDGEWVTYFDSGILKKVRISGGAAQTIMPGRLGRTSGYHYLENSLIHTGANDFIWTFDPVTGASNLVNGFDLMDATRVYRWPELLPDGATILVSATSAMANADSVILLYDTNSGISREVITNAFNARYLAQTGHIVFIRESALWAVPFDLDRSEITGQEVKLVDQVQTNGILGSASYAISELGRLVYLRGVDVAGASIDVDVNVVGRDGGIIDVIDIPGRVGQLDLSSDAKLLSYTSYDNSDSDIWVWNIEQKVAGRRTFEGMSRGARWSGDDRRLVYVNQAESKNLSGVWAVSSDGSSPSFEVFSDSNRFGGIQTQSVSANADTLFFFSGAAQIGQGSLWSLDLTGEEFPKVDPIQLEVSPNTEEVWWSRIAISPNGNWITYVSNESGSNQIYVRPYPNILSGKWQVSASDAASPLWSESSNELFFRSGEKFYSVEYEEVDSETRKFIDLSEPRYLFSHSIVENHLTFPAYVHDGRNDRFVILSSESEGVQVGNAGGAEETTLVVVENWFEELSMKVTSFQQ